MSRFTEKQYRQRISIAMAVYVAAMLLAWPTVQTQPFLWLRIALVFAPVLPMLYVIWLMARRVWHSDEFEQRTHLIALGVSTAVVAALSLVGGFLVAGKVVVLSGDVLIWVFPTMMATYGLTRWWVVTRLYGGEFDCADGGMPLYQRVLVIGGLMLMIALAAWWRGRLDALATGMFCGMGGGMLVLAVILAIRRRSRGKSAV